MDQSNHKYHHCQGFFLNVTRLKNSNVSLRKCLYRNTLLWVIITLILQESLHLLQKFTYNMEEMVKNKQEGLREQTSAKAAPSQGSIYF